MGSNTITQGELGKLLRSNPNISVNHAVKVLPLKREAQRGMFGRNRTEQAFGEQLMADLYEKKIKWVGYESHFIQLLEPDPNHRQATKAIYTPDFSVLTIDDELEFYEVKGRVRDNTQLRFKMAASLCFDHRFFLVKRAKSGGWSIKRQPVGTPSGEIKRKEYAG